MWETTLRYQRKLIIAYEERRKHRIERRKAKWKDVEPPPIEDVIRLRNWLLIVCLVLMFFYTLQFMTGTLVYDPADYPGYERFLPPGVENPPPENLPFYFGWGWYAYFLVAFIAPLAGVVDYIIWKRGGESIFEWG